MAQIQRGTILRKVDTEKPVAKRAPDVNSTEGRSTVSALASVIAARRTGFMVSFYSTINC